MKGLELAEGYFRAYGAPLLGESFGELAGRVAAGLIGLGSECLGFDDEHSRDHDWGPGFCLWLTGEDFRTHGAALARAYADLPRCFHGFERSTSEWGDGRVGVFETGAFFRMLLGQEPPRTLLDWLRLQEPNLCVATAGRVFQDPLGEVSALLERLREGYPDDVRRQKIAARCMVTGQSGQYNFVRSLLRGDLFAAQHAETKFCADAMSLAHLLNRRYAPYYKWLMRSTGVLPLLGEFMADRIAALVTTHDYDQKMEVINEVCAALVGELQGEGLSDSTSRFLVDHGPVIHEKIIDHTLRDMNVWIG